MREWWERQRDEGLLCGIAASLVFFGPVAIVALFVILMKLV
jgi:hypothetical protein